ncbi:MAG: element excision factor XisH family protein [Bacteroidota bacterium]
MARDIYHDAVKIAIGKIGWNVVDDPLTLSVSTLLTYHIDLAAERFLVASKEKEVIVIEVKSFVGDSDTYDFHTALGQYCVYRSALKFLNKPDRLLLAVPHATFLTFFQQPFIKQVLKDYNCEIISYDPVKKEIKYGKI